MPRSITLRWGTNNEHSLRMFQKPERTLAVLNIVKANGTQRVPIALPHNVTLADICIEWKKQGKQWDEIYTSEKDSIPFYAVRAIWLPPIGSIIWHVLHVNGLPVDGCSFTGLTKEWWMSHVGTTPSLTPLS